MPALWLLVLVPMVPCVAFIIDYHRVLKRKSAEANDLIGLDGARELYLKQWGGTNTKPRAIVLFEENYKAVRYVFPLVTIAIVCTAWSIACALQLANHITICPRSAIFGFIGAYTWSITALYRLRRTDDLAPRTLHAIWIHLLITPVIAGIAAHDLRAFDMLCGFGLGLLPLRSLIEWLTTRTRTLLGIGADTLPGETPNLDRLQGASREVVARLFDEGITSVNHLAYGDPVRIMLVTGLERKVLLDLMDQALLYMYLGDDVAKTRFAGLRGAIEACELFEQLNADDSVERTHGEDTLEALAAILERDKGAVRNLLRTLSIDAQAQLLHELWSSTFEEQRPPTTLKKAA